MRLNKFLAEKTHLSRRGADNAIKDGLVLVNGQKPNLGATVNISDKILLNGIPVTNEKIQKKIILFNKPKGYICSKNGQGNPTIYDILPKEFIAFNSIGRLDKDSSGLLVLTNDGSLHYELSHPSKQKIKKYIVSLDKPLIFLDQQKIKDGIKLTDGISKFAISLVRKDGKVWQIEMHEGKNRQIRRTFKAIGYTVIGLHRTAFGEYELSSLESGKWREIDIQ